MITCTRPKWTATVAPSVGAVTLVANTDSGAATAALLSRKGKPEDLIATHYNKEIRRKMEYDTTLVPEPGTTIRVGKKILSRNIMGLPIEEGDELEVLEIKEFGNTDIIRFEKADGETFGQLINQAKLWRDTPITLHVKNSVGAQQSFRWEYI